MIRLLPLSGINSLLRRLRAFDMVRARLILSHRSLRDIVRNNHSVAKSSRDFFEGLMLRFSVCGGVSDSIAFFRRCRCNSRKPQVGHDEKEDRTGHKHVVVVLLDIGKCAGAGFGDYHGALALTCNTGFSEDAPGFSYLQHSR